LISDIPQWSRTPIVEMRSITKRFAGVTALDGVSISLNAGEVHALLGENGSGKSTLIKILSGVQPADEGEIYFEGHHVDWKNPLDVQKVGVATIHQEINLIPNIDIASNIFLNWEPMVGKTCLIDFKEMYKKTFEVLKSIGVNLDPKTKVSRLRTAEKQLVEISKAIARKMRVLVLDEPTATLPAKEVEILFDIIQKLKTQGIAILYVSHRLEEIECIADHVTIIRDGKLVATKNKKELTVDEIIRLMVGRDVVEIQRSCKSLNNEVFRVENFSSEGAFQKINLNLKEGEILGIAGLVGSGRSGLVASLGGARSTDSGRAFIGGKEIGLTSPSVALRRGIGFLPSERKAEGLSTLLSVKDNIVMASLKKLSNNYGLLSDNIVSIVAREFVEKLQIKVFSLDQNAGSLSGGNQQKLVLGKVLARGSKVLIFDEPTRGIDVGTRREIYGLLDELASAGNSIILSSSDLPELIQTCDRIIVLFNGTIVEEFCGSVSQEELLRAVLGQSKVSARAKLDACEIFREDSIPDDKQKIKKTAGTFKRTQKLNIGNMAWQAFGVPLFVFALIIFFSLGNPGFASWANVINLSRQLSILLILSIAQSFAIITRGVDMSIGSTMALVSMTVGLVGLGSGSLPLGILAGLAVGMLVGIFNGAVIGCLKVDPFIVTLGVMYIGRGTSLLVNDGQPVFGFPTWISYISEGTISVVPFLVILASAVALICQVAFTKTRFGRHITAIGGNIDGARIMGVRVGVLTGAGYVLSGILSGIAGIILTARFFSSQPTLGSGAHLEAITAAIIGGMSLDGGRGDVWGVLTGVLVIGILSNGMNITNVPAYTQLVVMGGALILSLIIDRIRQIALEKQLK
jgi:rhamnose transport system ATP-binding protein